MIISVASGKGGTGKTTLTGAFAFLAKESIVADCDVDALNLHILLHPKVIKNQEFKGSKLAVIDYIKCIRYGLCMEKCRFNAITKELEVDQFSCEGCGVYTVVCPTNAIALKERISGYVYISKTKFGFMTQSMCHKSR